MKTERITEEDIQKLKNYILNLYGVKKITISYIGEKVRNVRIIFLDSCELSVSQLREIYEATKQLEDLLKNV